MTYNQWNNLKLGEHILVLMPEPYEKPVLREFIFDDFEVVDGKLQLHLNYLDDPECKLGSVIRTFDSMDQMLSCISEK